MIHLTLQYTEQDYLDAQRLFFRSTRTLRWSRAALAVVGVMMLLVGSLSLLIRDWVLALFPFVFGTFAILLYPVIMPWFWRKEFASHRQFQSPFEIVLHDDGMRVTSAASSGDIKWPMYLKWLEDDRMFMMFSGPRVFQMVPKRVLSPEQQAELRSLLQQKIKR